jgi:hypothetical protein
VYIGIFDVGKFKVALIDAQPDLGEKAVLFAWPLAPDRPHLGSVACSERPLWTPFCNLDAADMRPVPHLRQEPYQLCHIWSVADTSNSCCTDLSARGQLLKWKEQLL